MTRPGDARVRARVARGGRLTVCAALLAAAACAPSASATLPAGGRLPAAPPGWRMVHAADAVAPSVAALARDARTTPVEAAHGVYVPAAAGGLGSTAAGAAAAITVTVAHYADAAGAQAAYNGWFATFGFMASAERTPLDLGTQAERFDAGAPPLHAGLARDDRRFVVVEAGPRVDGAARDGAIAALLAAGLEAGGATAGPAAEPRLGTTTPVAPEAPSP